jgi:hypothetical protein
MHLFPPAYIQHILQLVRNTYFEIYKIYSKIITAAAEK